jgi:hypothetical protein
MLIRGPFATGSIAAGVYGDDPAPFRIAWPGRLRQPYFVKELAGEKRLPYRSGLCILPDNLY